MGTISGKILAAAIVALVLGGAVAAYTSSARNSLLRSRDEVADQRYQLEKAYNDLGQKIEELQRQQYTIGRYLQDCDRTLREIDRALTAQDSAYRSAR